MINLLKKNWSAKLNIRKTRYRWDDDIQMNFTGTECKTVETSQLCLNEIL